MPQGPTMQHTQLFLDDIWHVGSQGVIFRSTACLDIPWDMLEGRVDPLTLTMRWTFASLANCSRFAAAPSVCVRCLGMLLSGPCPLPDYHLLLSKCCLSRRWQDQLHSSIDVMKSWLMYLLQGATVPLPWGGPFLRCREGWNGRQWLEREDAGDWTY